MQKGCMISNHTFLMVSLLPPRESLSEVTKSVVES